MTTGTRWVPLVIDQPTLPRGCVGLLQVRQLLEESGVPGRLAPDGDAWLTTINATLYVLRDLPHDTRIRLEVWAQQRLERLRGDDEGEPDPWATHRVNGAVLLQLHASDLELPLV